MRALLPGLLAVSAACGGLHTGGSGGGSGHSGCTSTLNSELQVASPASPNGFASVRSLAFLADGRLLVLNSPESSDSFVTLLGPSPNHAWLGRYGAGKVPGRAVDLAAGAEGKALVLVPRGLSSPGRVTVFASDGGVESSWPTTGNGQDDAFSLTVDQQGRVVVGGAHMYRYDTSGAYQSEYGTPTFPIGAVTDPRGFTWVAELSDDTILKYDSASGAKLATLGGAGSGPGLFDGNNMDPVTRWGPTRLALDAQGNLYANDPFVSRIQKLSPTGSFLGEFGFGGSRAVGPLAVDPLSGNVYVGRGSAIDILCPL